MTDQYVVYLEAWDGREQTGHMMTIEATLPAAVDYLLEVARGAAIRVNEAAFHFAPHFCVPGQSARWRFWVERRDGEMEPAVRLGLKGDTYFTITRWGAFVSEPPLIEEATRAEATVQLLASSTSSRYIREARRIAAQGDLVPRLQRCANRRRGAQRRARHLIRQVNASTQRTVAEVDLALLLCALAASGPQAADTLRLAATSRCSWTRSLAKELLARCAPAGSRPGWSEDDLCGDCRHPRRIHRTAGAGAGYRCWHRDGGYGIRSALAPDRCTCRGFVEPKGGQP